MNFKNIATLIIGSTFLTACMSAQEHKQDVSGGPSTFTLGKVQSSIQKGMSQNQVIEALGSPNIVTNDEFGNETWVYDKIATEGAYSKSGLAGGLILFGGQKDAGAYETTQKTLTVMLKFNRQKCISSIDYHQSKF